MKNKKIRRTSSEESAQTASVHRLPTVVVNLLPF